MIPLLPKRRGGYQGVNVPILAINSTHKVKRFYAIQLLINITRENAMPYTQEIVDELNILVRYNLATTQEGIKVHTHTANPATVAATHRLFVKGLVTQDDGGYLTHLGHEAAEQAQMLLSLLNPDYLVK